MFRSERTGCTGRLYDMYEADLNKNTFKKFSSELTDILNTVTDQLLYKEYHLHIAK